MSNVILERGGLTVEAYGDESEGIFKGGRKVAIPERLAKKLNRNRDRADQQQFEANRVRQGDSFERIYESNTTMRYGGTYNSSSLADFFPVDRSCGWASAIRMNLEVHQAPRMASVICCATDVPTLAVSRDRKRVFTGFVNLGVAIDTCVWDTMAESEMDQNADGTGDSINMEAEYLEEVNASLTEACNHICINGYAPNNVWGLRNNPYINTVLIDPPATTNPVISLRALTVFLALREKQTIINIGGLFNKRYTIFLPVDLVSAMASTYVTLGDQQMSTLAILTGVGGSLANDPAIPTFNVIALNNLEPWHDGSQIGYIMLSEGGNFASGIKWWKPFSMLDLGESRHGLRSFRYMGSRCGSLEVQDLGKMLRILIPQA